MDARPILVTLAQVFEEHGLEVIMIGDGDFLFRKTPANLRKLKKITMSLGGVLFQAYYPASNFYRLVRDHDSLQLDFRWIIGVTSFERVRSPAKRVEPDSYSLLVAGPIDIIKSERSGRAKEMKKKTSRKDKLEALKCESELAVRDQIRRLLRLPPDRRTHFLRKRIGIQASCL